MYVPAAAPVQAGHAIQLAMPKGAADDVAPDGYAPVEATVVRVDRHSLLSMGHVAVGVKFASRGAQPAN